MCASVLYFETLQMLCTEEMPGSMAAEMRSGRCLGIIDCVLADCGLLERLGFAEDMIELPRKNGTRKHHEDGDAFHEGRS